MKERDVFVDTLMYVASLSYSAYRFAKGQPFDIQDRATSEFFINHYTPLIKHGTNLRAAHKDFLFKMFSLGWKYGDEDFNARTHPDLVAWIQLSFEAKQKYAYDAALIKSAKDFYIALKEELEEDLMGSFLPIPVGKEGVKQLWQ
jgi:hypothetical protein